MIIDTDQDIQVYDVETGLHKVTLIDLKNNTVCTEDSLCFNLPDVQIVHKL